MIKIRPLKFVVFDDSPHLLGIQANLIRALGHTAHEVIITVRDEIDGLESASERIARLDPDAIVADCQLFSGEISGAKLLQRLEREYWSKTCRRPLVIASSERLGADLRQMAHEVFFQKRHLLDIDEMRRLSSWHHFIEIIERIIDQIMGVCSFKPVLRAQVLA
jgi:hypothetical protein